MTATYVEDFDDGPGGWMRVIDNYSPIGALPVRDGAVRCQGPWWVDYNHAPPGGGYLQLLMCLVTKGGVGEQVREAAGDNRFVRGGYPTDFTDARLTLRLRGELEAAGTKFSVLLQANVDGLISGWVLTGQTFEVTPDWSEQTVTCVPDRARWTSIGSRHDRTDTYGERPLEQVLGDVNVNMHLIMFPVQPRPMGRIDGDPHLLRAGRDYPIWPSSIAQGFVDVDRIAIEFAK
jgi:hypothetical protein